MNSISDSKGFRETSVVEENSTKQRLHAAAWRSPSNIALVKYWGKYGLQLPRNPSISLTLSKAFTDTYIDLYPRSDNSDGVQMRFFYEGEINTKFGARIQKFLEQDHIQRRLPWLTDFDIIIESINSFPHSVGIASSASAMSALALGLTDISWKTGHLKLEGLNSFKQLHSHPDFLRASSELARLASGSASRSVYPIAAIWGESNGGSNEYAVPAAQLIDSTFHSMHDAILIIDSAPKSVSSSAGHGLMEDNPFAQPRYNQADQHMDTLMNHMKNGDLAKAGAIIETEALTLHALMMQSGYILLKPGSLSVIEMIRQKRNETGWQMYFTIDAGPNIHLLYPDNIADEVKAFIQSDLATFCENEKVIFDQVGSGPLNIQLLP